MTNRTHGMHSLTERRIRHRPDIWHATTVVIYKHVTIMGSTDFDFGFSRRVSFHVTQPTAWSKFWGDIRYSTMYHLIKTYQLAPEVATVLQTSDNVFPLSHNRRSLLDRELLLQLKCIRPTVYYIHSINTLRNFTTAHNTSKSEQVASITNTYYKIRA